ncbi:hypothetical protein D039_2054 [Vibrio parahaemolyticus EKP-028]|nr:hypothetical protein D039_2054 [Vibrio parahaemolyticus EKP-028]
MRTWSWCTPKQTLMRDRAGSQRLSSSAVLPDSVTRKSSISWECEAQTHLSSSSTIAKYLKKTFSEHSIVASKY